MPPAKGTLPTAQRSLAARDVHDELWPSLTCRSRSLLFLKQADIADADDVSKHQQHKRHRCRVTEIKEAKCGAIDVQADGLCCEPRPALCQYEYLVKHSKQVHRAKQQRDQDRRL